MIAVPLLASSGHSGTVHPRTAPELSDIALFAVAVVAVWRIRRALRRRFAERPRDLTRDPAPGKVQDTARDKD